MFLLVSSALAQWATFEPPSSAPSMVPWGEGQRLEAGVGLVTGLGGDGTTVTDTDFPGPGFLDAFADLQLSGAYRVDQRLDLVATAYLGTGSILGAGAGLRYWVARNELGGFGVQVDLGLLYLRAALPMTATAGPLTLYCAPTVQAALGAQARTPFGVSLAIPDTDLLLTAEGGIAVTGQDAFPPDWDEGVKYYGALTLAYRVGARSPDEPPWQPSG